MSVVIARVRKVIIFAEAAENVIRVANNLVSVGYSFTSLVPGYE